MSNIDIRFTVTSLPVASLDWLILQEFDVGDVVDPPSEAYTYYLVGDICEAILVDDSGKTYLRVLKTNDELCNIRDMEML